MRLCLTTSLSFAVLIHAGTFVHGWPPDAEQDVCEALEQRLRELSGNRQAPGPAVFDKVVEGKDVGTYTVTDGRGVRWPMRAQRLQSSNKLHDLVLSDNTAGVYPGGLFWSDSLRKGILHELPSFPDRSIPVEVTFRDVSVSQPGRDLSKLDDPASDSMSDDAATHGRSATFTFDGTEGGFTDGLVDMVSTFNTQYPRLSIRVATGQSSQTALLKMGLSVEGWGAKLGIESDRSTHKRQSFAIVSLDETYFTVNVSDDNFTTLFPCDTLDERDQQRMLILVARHGEPVYVNSVRFGRRVLISIRAEGSEEDLRNAIRVAFNGFGVNASAAYKRRIKNVQQSFTAQAVVIGGDRNGRDRLIKAVIGNPVEAMRNIQDYLIQTSASEMLAENGDIVRNLMVDDNPLGTIISFTTAYVYDLKPLQVFETVEFAGPVPDGPGIYPGENITLPRKAFNMGGNNHEAPHTTSVRSDTEVHSDDWTGVEVGYTLSLSEDRRECFITIQMDVQELESDRSYDNKTHLRTQRRQSLYRITDPDDPRTIEILSMSRGSKRKLYEGYVRKFNSFPDFGSLRGIRVRIDGSGGDDHKLQRLECHIEGVRLHLREAIVLWEDDT